MTSTVPAWAASCATATAGTRSDPGSQYGAGGTLEGKKYMLSLTFNAPREAFDDPNQYLFQGKGVDDLFFPIACQFL